MQPTEQRCTNAQGFSVVALTDEQDKVEYLKRLPNDLSVILNALQPHQESIEGLVVESTYNWYWLVDGLMEAGYRLHLANTAAARPPAATPATRSGWTRISGSGSTRPRPKGACPGKKRKT